MCVDRKHGGREIRPRVCIPKPFWSLCSIRIGLAFVDTWRVPTEHLFASMQYWLCFAQKARRVFCSKDGIMPSRYEKFQAYRVVFIEAGSTLVKTFDRKQMQVPFSKQKNQSAIHRTCLLYSITQVFKKPPNLSSIQLVESPWKSQKRWGWDSHRNSISCLSLLLHLVEIYKSQSVFAKLIFLLLVIGHYVYRNRTFFGQNHRDMWPCMASDHRALHTTIMHGLLQDSSKACYKPWYF